jgi:hypothetical protein
VATAAATTTVATTLYTANTSTTAGTPPNSCVPLVSQVVHAALLLHSVAQPLFVAPLMPLLVCSIINLLGHITMAVTAPTLLVMLCQSTKAVTTLMLVALVVAVDPIILDLWS